MLQQQKIVLGGSSAAAGFRFYKIVITAITSGSSVVLGNVELLVGGSNVIPVMSGYTSPSPNVVSVSGDASGNFGWHATRNDSSVLWAKSFSSGDFWQIDFGAGVTHLADTLAITNHPTTNAVTPEDFTLQVSNDGTTYSTILTVTGQSWSAGQRITYSI